MSASRSREPEKYASPNKIKTKSALIPTNCGEPKDVISNLSLRAAYRRATAHIEQDPYNNCCTLTVDRGHEVKLWKATELPVKLTRTSDRSMTFLYAKELKYSM